MDKAITSLPEGDHSTLQIVYLNFDGALTDYNGEAFSISQVNMAPSKLSGKNIREAVATLNEAFAAQNIVFCAEKPETDEYSTIHIGYTDSFAPYGKFSGISETVDYGNLNHSDKAFVILSGQESMEMIMSTIAHETGHLLGTLDHAGDAVSRYAAKYYVVEAGKVLNGTVLQPTDEAYINNGGSATNITVSSGALLRVSSGGVATGIKVLYGGEVLPQGQTVDGADKKTVIKGTNASGAFSLSNGVASGFLVNTNRELCVRNGGRVVNTIVNNGTKQGKLKVSSGGIAENTNVNNGFVMVLGGKTNSTTLTNQAEMYVASKGAAGNTIVSGAKTYVYVSSTGAVQDTVLRGGGLFVSYGGTALRTTVSSGAIAGFYGGNGTSTTVSKGGLLELSLKGFNQVFTSAILQDTVVHSGGNVQIKTGTKHTGTVTLHQGAEFCVNSGAILEFNISNYTAQNCKMQINNLSLVQGNVLG